MKISMKILMKISMKRDANSAIISTVSVDTTTTATTANITVMDVESGTTTDTIPLRTARTTTTRQKARTITESAATITDTTATTMDMIVDVTTRKDMSPRQTARTTTTSPDTDEFLGPFVVIASNPMMTDSGEVCYDIEQSQSQDVVNSFESYFEEGADSLSFKDCSFFIDDWSYWSKFLPPGYAPLEKVDSFPLQHCQGDCDSDDDCSGSLFCAGEDVVPKACIGSPIPGVRYCSSPYVPEPSF